MGRSRRSIIIGVASAIVLLVACQSDSPEAAPADGDRAAPHAVHWAYDGETGPERWAMLSGDFALCGSGAEQSPIDLVRASSDDLPDIEFGYQPSALTIANNGHTVQVTYEPGSTIGVDGRSYELKQFHFHGPSEHTIDGEAYPLEMHLVHASPDGDLAVVGVMIEAGSTENAALASIWEHAPAQVSDATRIAGITIHALDLLPSEGTYYAYGGSLTTPPCSEGVQWYVLATPIEMSQAAIDRIAEVMGENSRPIQPLNDRELALDPAAGNTR